MNKTLRFDSLLVHGGLEAGPSGATSVPIVQSSSFAYQTAEALEDVFRGRAIGQVYTRIGNPTTEALERRLGLLEGGGTAIVTASGMAAITTAVLTILRSGDEILSSSSLFGGTFSLFRDTLSNYGITAAFVDPLDLDGFRNAINERTRLLFVETIGNPKLDVPDVPALARIAHDAGIPIMVDSTVSTPYLASGAELEADILAYSTSKYINGTGTTIGGAIIDRGVFDWNSPKFPHFEQFYKKYRAFAFTARARKLVHKDVGACAAPFNSFLLTEGIQDSPHHAIASKLYGGSYGGLLTFGTGDKTSAFKVINGLKLAKNLANIGDAKTLVIHPASTICADYNAEEKALMGVTEDLVRVSVGIEDSRDIIDDFRQALDTI